MSGDKSHGGGDESSWGSSDEDEDDKKKVLLTQKWNPEWGSAGEEKETTEGKAGAIKEGSTHEVKGVPIRAIKETGHVGASNAINEKESNDDKYQTNVKENKQNLHKKSEVKLNTLVKSSEIKEIQAAELALRDVQAVTELGRKNGGWTAENSKENDAEIREMELKENSSNDDDPTCIAGGIKQGTTLQTVHEEDEASKWSDSEVEVVPLMNSKADKSSQLKSDEKSDVGSASKSKSDGKKLVDWSSSSSDDEDSHRISNPVNPVLEISHDEEATEEANRTKQQAVKLSEIEESSWSSGSEDLNGLQSTEQREKILSLPDSSAPGKSTASEKPTDVILKSQKSTSWTASPSAVVQEDHVPTAGFTNHNKASSDIPSLKSPIRNIPTAKDLFSPQMDEDTGEICNEVRLTRVTSSEIFGEMELEVEINPFVKGPKGSSAGQGDSIFVDPFKVKAEPANPVGGDNNTRSKKSDPIPYSKLLGIKASSKSINDKKLKSQTKEILKISKTNYDETLEENTSSCSNSEIQPTADSASTFKKPLFSRLKRKISKTFLRSNSSLQVSKSLPTLNEEVHTASLDNSTDRLRDNVKSISVDDEEISKSESKNKSDFQSVPAGARNAPQVPESIVLEHRSLQLLKEARDIAEKLLNPEDKVEVQTLLQSVESKESLDQLLLELDSDISDMALKNATVESDVEQGVELPCGPNPNDPDKSSYSQASQLSCPPNSARNNGPPGPRSTAASANLPRYCDTMDPCHPDPNAVAHLLNELGCMYTKILGSNCGFTQESRELQSKFRELQDRLALCERCKAQMEAEIARLLNELKAMQRELDEECQRRCNLEQLVAQLKSQLECLEDELCMLRGEIDQLNALIEDLKSQLRSALNDIQRLTQEVIALEGCVKEKDEEIHRLKDALERCCKRVDDLINENSRLRAEVCKLQRELDAMRKERDALAALLNCERNEWAAEKCLLEEINDKLKKQVACLENEKEEICKRFMESTDLHHEELDCLRQEKEKFECLYEEEKKAREDLEKKLRDCEEQKRIQKEQSSLVTNIPSCVTREQSSPCDKIRFDVERLEQERTELQNHRRCLDLEQQLANAQTERSVLMRQIDEYKCSEQQQKQVQQFEKDKLEMATKKIRFDVDDNSEKTIELIENNKSLTHETEQLKKMVNERDERIKTLVFERLKHEELEQQSAQRCLDLKQQLENSQGERSVLMRQVEECKFSEQQQVQQFKDKLEVEKKKLQIDVDANSKTDIEKLTERIKILNVERFEQETTANQYSQRCLDLEQQLANAQTEKSVLIRQIEEYKCLEQQQVQQLEDKLKNEIKNLQNVDANSKKTIEDLTEKNKAIKHDIEQLQQMVNDRDERIRALDVERLEQERTELQNVRRYLDLEQQLANAQTERSVLMRKIEGNKSVEQQQVRQLEDKLKIEKKKIQNVDTNSKKTIEELTQTNKTLKHETKQLKKMVNERDERIGALESVVAEVKRKYAEQHKQLRIQKIQMEALKSDMEKLETQNQKEQSQLEQQRRLLIREKAEVEKEWTKLKNSRKDAAKEKASLQNLKTMKERIESDVIKVQDAISSRMVDRSELETLRKSYEDKLLTMKNQFDAQLEMNRQLAEINEYLGRQAQDRALVEKIRDSNETVLRKELNSVSVATKLDNEKFKTLIKERDEEISSLRRSVGLLKDKYAKEAQQREELVKKVSILSSLSQESLNCSPSLNNNNSVQSNHPPPQRS